MTKLPKNCNSCLPLGVLAGMHIWNKQMSNRRKCIGYMKAR